MQEVHSKQMAIELRDKYRQSLIGAQMFPETLGGKHPPTIETIQYLDIVPSSEELMKKCFEYFLVNSEWQSLIVTWQNLPDEFMVWAISHNKQTGLWFVRDLETILYFRDNNELNLLMAN